MKRFNESYFLAFGMISGILALSSLFLPYTNVFSLFGEVSGFTFYQEMLSRHQDTFGLISSHVAGVFVLVLGSIGIIMRYFNFIDGFRILRILFGLGGFFLLVGDYFTFALVKLGGWQYPGEILLGFIFSVLAGSFALLAFFSSFYMRKEPNFSYKSL